MIGKYTAKVDEKGRLFVPAKLRGELGETFFVTIGTNGGRRCLTVYTQAGWESLCARYDALPLSQKSGTTSFLFSNAVECSPEQALLRALPLLALAANADPLVMIQVMLLFDPVEHQNLVPPGDVAQRCILHTTAPF